jgi:hypothetical protein
MRLQRCLGTARRVHHQRVLFAIKAEVSELDAETFTFRAQKTMYGGKQIAAGDTVFIFASENEGGPGLIATGVVSSARAVKKSPASKSPSKRRHFCADSSSRAIHISAVSSASRQNLCVRLESRVGCPSHTGCTRSVRLTWNLIRRRTGMQL